MEIGIQIGIIGTSNWNVAWNADLEWSIPIVEF